MCSKGFVCFDEVMANDDESRVRFNEIIANNVKHKKGFVIDPALCMLEDTVKDSKLTGREKVKRLVQN